MDETFSPLSGVSIELLLVGEKIPQRRTSTDKNGVFTIPDLASGKYTMRVAAQAFLRYEIQNIRINDGEDLHLRRILLEAGEAFGNCVVRINATSQVQRTGRADIELAGRVLMRRGERAEVSLIVFTETETIRLDPTSSDKKGRFRAVVPAAGDVRLEVGIQKGSGEIVTPQQLNVGWTELGDRVEIPKIKLNRLGLGHFCY
jgi:hypothetical protein